MTPDLLFQSLISVTVFLVFASVVGRLRRRGFRPLLPVALFLGCALAPMSCTCGGGADPQPSPGIIACQAESPSGPVAPPLDPASKTVAPGSLRSGFLVTSSGDPAYSIEFTSVPARGPSPQLGAVYSGVDGSRVLGAGFSLTGSSSILSRCPHDQNQEGEIRDVRFDSLDKLCLDGKRLIAVAQAPGITEYRTLPDTQVRVIGHFPAGVSDEDRSPDSALFFEAHLPSGLVVEYGSGGRGKPRALSGVPRAFLATQARDARGNTTTYSYCFAEADGYTAEYALTEIRYGGFDGSNAAPPSRAVRFAYSTKDAADVRVHHARGMALQSSLELDELQMFGPNDALVRRYGFTYELSPTTQRTRLTSVEECGSDAVCTPPTRFQYKSDAPGFKRIATGLGAPTSRRASPMLFDVTGDGLDDLVVPDVNPALSTPQNPITEWLVATNRGEAASPPYFAAPKLAFSQEWTTVDDSAGPADPSILQPELGSSIDYDQDGRADVLLHDVHGVSVNETVLLARPDQTFRALDTRIRKPFALGSPPAPPALSSPGASVHLADLDGDGVQDRIQCQDHGVELTDVPGEQVWTAQLWRPVQGGEPAGFEPMGQPLAPLAGTPCDTHLYTVDLNADRKSELLVPRVIAVGGTSQVETLTYKSLTRLRDGSFEVFDTKLPIQQRGGRIVFLDANGDRLPDAVASGSPDHRLRTYIYTGSTFAAAPVDSLEWDRIGEQDTFFRWAVPLDYNGDGRSDLLLPIPGGVWPNIESALPRWFVLQATSSQSGPTFTPVDPQIPFEAQLADDVTLADPRAPRVGDVNGDGAADVVLVLGGVFNVFQNLAADQDVLVGVSDGMNDHDPGEPGYAPSVGIAYGHLTDEGITSGVQEGDPALERALYRSRSDAADECAYPRHCVVGRRRVVKGYSVADGEGGQRHFGVRYFDGRYHRLGLGDLGFAKRIITDLDTGAGVAELYDHVTTFETESGLVVPFAGQATRTWQWVPALPSQPDEDQVELLFVDVTPTFVPTSGGKTYFTLPTRHRARRLEGVYPSPRNPAQPVEAYVAEVEQRGGADVLSDTTRTVVDFDTFGNVREAALDLRGVDLTLHVKRTFKNDTDRWVLGQLQTQQECSAASMQSRCRTLTRTTTPFGEVHTETTATGDESPEGWLSVTYARDDFGNVTDILADDAFGHHRTLHTAYDAEGTFPVSYTNGAGQTTLVAFDADLGLLEKQVDPNQLVTTWSYGSLGRLERVERPDGTETRIALSRARDGSKDNAWRVTQRTVTSGGADDAVEYDRLGRPVRLFTHGPDTPEQPGSPPRVMQVLGYDRLSGNVARRSVPASEGTPEPQLLFDRYDFDMRGREVRHTTPWNATTETAYNGLRVEIRDPLRNLTVVANDALGRPLTITDARQGTTAYTYGPFDTLYTVTDPGRALTRTTRDALGRVKTLDDPNRGTTTLVHDGFGELVSSTDALGRVITFGYDSIGRTESRTDRHGAESETTSWTWDTAENGIGKLHKLTSPDGEKVYGYTPRGQLESITLAVDRPGGERERLRAGFRYDLMGRVDTLTYPSPNGAAPFVVRHGFDSHGNLLSVRDDATGDAYWRLTDADAAGRYRKEVFGNSAETVRSYYAEKQALKSLVTRLGGTDVQDLSVEVDARLDVMSRTDALQPRHRTERFRVDELHRVTCAYFSAREDPLAPCAQRYDHAPNGNLTFKSDVGVLAYGDPAHPHAVTSAGGGSFGYDPVGNQVARPGGTVVRYTPFDLPRTITQGASTISFGYDGDQTRIRKTTPAEETLYLGDLYERVTRAGSAAAEHRYYVHSPERVVAVVARGGESPGTRYLHADHLGSVHAVTNDLGTVDEWRSYDPYGQRRSPIWGEPAPPSFTSKTTKGFTGHETDEELGLVNMKGRVMDPRLGRFMTTDPVVSTLWSGQALNAYSYVRNSPLTRVDPTGFVDEPPGSPGPGAVPAATQGLTVWVFGEPRKPPKSKEKEAERQVDVGAAAPQTDVDTTGSSAADMPESAAAAPEDDERPGLVRAGLGFAYGVGQTWFPGGFLVPSPSPTDWTFEFWRGAGQIATGAVELAGGFGLLGGGAAGAGAGVAGALPTGGASLALTAAGASAVAVGAVAISEGGLGVLAGIQTFANSLSLSTGSGSGSSAPQTQGTSRQAVGAAREARVAELTGGRVSGEKITASNLGHTDIDVIAGNGDLVMVGGPAKASNLGGLGRVIKLYQAEAASRGVGVQAHFAAGTPQTVIDFAAKRIGIENVFKILE